MVKTKRRRNIAKVPLQGMRPGIEMIAAIYARKSTQQAVADEAKSVRRQIDHARQYAAHKGWAVAEEHMYVDDGNSWAEFANRPGSPRLMNAVKPRAPFQTLVMSEESRLGREAIETAYALAGMAEGVALDAIVAALRNARGTAPEFGG